MIKKPYEYNFPLRCGVCFFVVFCLFLFSVLRIISIDSRNYDELQTEQSSYTIAVGSPRGSILDTNGVAITNSKMQTIAAINPTAAAINAVKGTLEGEEADRVLTLLTSGKPAVCVLPYEIECDGITCINVPVRVTENTVAHHIVGYLDGDGLGADGIEYAYNDLLSDENVLTAAFSVNGKGEVLLGVEPTFSGGTEKLSNAVWLTLDINIQKKLEKLSAPLLSGAVLVAETKTNKIRAAVSLPDFSPSDISASLTGENSPMLNKTLNCYNIGSAFKPCIAAAAIEENLGDYTVECSGKTVIEKRTFNCHKTDGHGIQSLKDAIKNSCNCYFYELSCKLGSNKIYKAAEIFSLGGKIKLGENLFTANANLPGKGQLTSSSAMANFGIGQGDIMLSPISMLNLYSAIANGGKYYMPSIVEKTTESGKTRDFDIKSPTRVMNKDTADIIKTALIEVIESGTGTAAKSEKVTAAGKTATAQTGRRYEDGTEITNSWFCGFFPADNPKYTCIIMADGRYEKSPAEIFKEISECLS